MANSLSSEQHAWLKDLGKLLGAAPTGKSKEDDSSDTAVATSGNGDVVKSASDVLTSMSSPGGTPSNGQPGSDEHAELRAKTLMLQPTLQAKLKHQSDLFNKLVVDAEPKLAQMAKAAVTADAKRVVADKRALVAKKKAEVEREMKELANDLEAVESGGARPEELVKVLARHGSGGKVAPTTETAGLGLHSLNENLLKRDATTTTASLDDGKATVEKRHETWSLDPKGETATTSKEKAVSSADFTMLVSEEKKANVSLTGKVTHEKSTTAVVELPDGRKSSDETSESSEFSTKGAEWGNGIKQTDFDGSVKAAKKRSFVERDDGKLKMGQELSVAETNAKGTERSSDKKASGSVIAGKDGIGAGADGEAGKKITSKDGRQAGVVVGLHASVICNVGEPKGDPPKYPVTLTVNIGGSIAVSAGRGQTDESKGKGSAEVKAGEDRTMVVTHLLDEEQLGLYTKALKDASAGSKVSATEKEFAIIAAVAKNNTSEAMRLFKSGGKIDKKAADAIASEGDSIKVSESTTKGLATKSGGKGVSFGGGVAITDKNSMEMKRNHTGGIDLQTDSEHAVDTSLSGSMTPAAVGLSVGYKQEHKTSFGYAITLEQKDDPSGELLEALGKCRSEADYKAFLDSYKGRYKFNAKTEGVADAVGLHTGLSLGGVEIAGMDEGHGVDEQTKTDADGELIEKTVGGHGNVGAQLFGQSESKNDDAVAHIHADQTAELDLSTTTHSNHNKRADAKEQKFLQEKWAGKGPASGVLATAAGSGKKPDIATHDVGGLKLATKDLLTLGKAVCYSPAAFIGWRRRADEKDDIIKAAAAIVKGKGSAAAVAEALARFIGGDSDERLKTVRLIMRGDYKASAGKAFEFPDEIRGLQESYDEVTADDMVDKVNKIGAKTQATAMLECQRLLKMADSVMSGVSACQDFKSPEIKAEMIQKLELTRENLTRATKGFGHKKTAEDMKEFEEIGNRLVNQCSRFWCDKEGLVADLWKLKGDEKYIPNSDRGEARDMIKKLARLIHIWRSQWFLLKDNYKARGMPEAALSIPTILPDETLVDFWDKACQN